MIFSSIYSISIISHAQFFKKSFTYPNFIQKNSKVSKEKFAHRTYKLHVPPTPVIKSDNLNKNKPKDCPNPAAPGGVLLIRNNFHIIGKSGKQSRPYSFLRACKTTTIAVNRERLGGEQWRPGHNL